MKTTVLQPKTHTQSAPSAFFAKGSQSSFSMNPVQAKLNVNQPHDPYEKEADAMADHVVQRLETKPSPIETKTDNNLQQKANITPVPSTPPVQTKCATCEHEEKLQKKEEEPESENIELQRKSALDGNAAPPPTDDDDEDETIQRKCASCAHEEGTTIQRFPSWDEIKDGASSAYDDVKQGLSDAGDAIGEAVDTVTSLPGKAVSWIASAAGEAALRLANMIVNRYGGTIRKADDGGIELIIDSITIFGYHAMVIPWSGSTKEKIIAQALVDVPWIGPTYFTLFGRGQMNASITAGIGPTVLKGIIIKLNPGNDLYSGTATLSAPVELLGNLTLTGILGVLANPSCVAEVIRLEGGLSISGTAGLESELVDTVTVTYTGGEFDFDNKLLFNNCLVFNLDLNALASISLFRHTLLSGKWNLANYAYEKCWPIVLMGDVFTGGGGKSGGGGAGGSFDDDGGGSGGSGFTGDGGSFGGGGASSSYDDDAASSPAPAPAPSTAPSATPSTAPSTSSAGPSTNSIAPSSAPASSKNSPGFTADSVLDSIIDTSKPILTPLPFNIDPDEKKALEAECPVQPVDPCADAPTGLTPDDPIKMIWMKAPGSDLYDSPITLIHLGKPSQYSLFTPRLLPDGSEMIGIEPQFMPFVGKPLSKRPFGRGRGSELRRFKTVLARFGYIISPETTGLDADHFQDDLWKGPNVFTNYWPLDFNANRSAGATQNVVQEVKWAEFMGGPVYLSCIADKDLKNRYFVISAVVNPEANVPTRGCGNRKQICPPVQTKLTVGQPNDPFEKEADSMADKVVQRMEITSPPGDEEDDTIQRKCAACEQEEKMTVQQKSEPGNGSPVDAALESKLSASKGSGNPLPESTRTQMESSFGADFSNVRVHNDNSSAQMSKDLHAQAFTHGSDVYFNSGKYDTTSKQGNHLLAHELTHVVQQGSAGDVVKKKLIQRQDDEDDSLPYDGPTFGPTDEELESGEEGASMDKAGIVQTQNGAKLRTLPSHLAPTFALLPLNTKVYIDRLLPGDWYEVYVEGHQRGHSLPVAQGTHGYIAKGEINTDMPDPNAWLFRITKSGQGALSVAAEVYQGQFKASWGKDYRYLVNVLAMVNNEKGRKYIYKEAPDDSWDKAKVVKGGQIWVPGVELVDALQGQISSGSISFEVLSAADNFFVGLGAFIVGLLHGAIMSIADIFVGAYDLVKMATEILMKLYRDTLIADTKKFIDDISNIKPSDIIDMVGEKWNAPDTWDRWKFRGYVTGYAIMEIVLMIFSVGILTAVKWAGKATKFGKLAEFLVKLPKVKKVIEGAKALKGAGVNKIRAGVKAAHSLSKLHAWAATVLRIPMHILTRLSKSNIETLQKLPRWAMDRFAMLSDRAMLKLLGCNSPCTVTREVVEEGVKLAAKAGTKLTDAKSVVAALKRIPNFNTNKIWIKLQEPSALMVAIREAELTDLDFANLPDFFSHVNLANRKAAYRAFARHLTGVVAEKKGDINKFNRITANMIKTEPRRGSALKGSMFEQWAKFHIPHLAEAEKKTLDLKLLLGSTWPRAIRIADAWVPESGEIWEIKHVFGKVGIEQLADYTAVIGKKVDGKKIKTVNYLFPTKEVGELNIDITKVSGRRAWYVDKITNEPKRLQ